MTRAAPAPPLAVLGAYAAPALPLAALTLPLYVVVPSFYAGELGVPLAAVGQALLAVRLFDAVNDPVVGVLADRWRPRLGRRRTWFALAVPLVIAATLMMFVPPDGAGAGWLLAAGLALSLATTACLVPYWAWGAELATDYDGRSRVTAAREATVVVGTLAAAATPAIADALGATGEGPALAALAVGVALLLPATALFTLAAVPEPSVAAAQPEPAREGLRRMGRNRPFLVLLAAFVLNGFANGLPATLFLFFVGTRLAAPEAAGAVLFLYFLCGLAGIPLWLAVARRIGKHRAWCAAMIGASAVFATVPFLGAGDLPAFLVVCVLTGLALGADLALPPSIQADVVDVDTADGGSARTGVYFAAWGLGTKLSLALAVGIAFPLLDAAGFDAAGGEQPPVALLALSLLYAAVPVAAKLAAVALMWNFPLGRVEQAALRARIDAGQPPAPVALDTSAK